MPANHDKILQRLRAFDFVGLFTQELLWNHYRRNDLTLAIDGVAYTLKPVAERGLAVFECVVPSGVEFPDPTVQRKIDTQVSKTARER